MSEKIIDEVMALAEEAIYCAETAQLCEFDGDHEGFIRYQGCSNNAYKAIRSKLREVLERKPLTDEQIEQVIGAKIGQPIFLVAKGFVQATERAHRISS